MSQLLSYRRKGTEFTRELPDPFDELLPGVPWGDHWEFFTPAYWLAQAEMSNLRNCARSPYCAERELSQELVFCLLGGFGITAELAGAAFTACEQAGLLARREESPTRWLAVLERPLKIGARTIRYRFPYQKARYLAGAMRHLRRKPPTGSGKALRDDLAAIVGVGLKTSSWVVRNCFDSDEVAILDIHVVRAGMLCGLYSFDDRVSRAYPAMEQRFLDFAISLGVRPAVLDCLIWKQMRELGRLPLDALRRRSFNPTEGCGLALPA